jgi:HAE1 family hydrophobic/amphiphilic exporter-1
MRQALGTAVFAGMIGVTLFGLVFTPAFYVASRSIAERLRRRKPSLQSSHAPPAPAE